MVLDYAEGRPAMAALRVLWDRGFAAVYLPDRLVAVSPDPLATQLIAHQIELPDDQTQRAIAGLEYFGLRPVKRSGPAH
jgi:hypothetical protein